MRAIRLFIATLALNVAGLAPALAFTNPFTGIVSFGDSLSDLGNTVAEFDSIPGGEDFLYDETGYNNNFYDVGRWSNGSVWVENLATSLGLPALQRNDGTGSNIFGTNYAWGGSTSGTGKIDIVINNLQTQVANYLNILDANPTGQPEISTTLFTVWSGGNDVINLIEDNTPITGQQIADNIGSAITTLYNAGGRSFLVPNLPALGDKPDFVNTPNEAIANDFVAAYNPLLEAELASLEAQYADILIIRVDIYTFVNDVIASPGAYGFSNVTDPAYVKDENDAEGGYVNANPNSYLFWDNTHPTEAGHQLIGNLAYSAVVAAVPEPGTLALLGIAAGAFVLLRRRRA